MRHHLRATALALAALLLLPVGPAGALAEDEEIIIEMDDGEAADLVEVDDLGSLDLGDLLTELETPAPTKPPAPTKTPAPTKQPEEKPPWLTSPRYPKDKVNFEKEIWQTLTEKWGLKDFQAAGLMSSLQAESSFCPYNVQGLGSSDDRGAYLYDTQDAVGFGLCQWTSSGRKADLLAFAASRGSKDLVWDFDTQMAFMQKELDMKTLKATQSMYEAAEWTVMRYERPSQRYANSWPGTRYEMGRRIYKKHTGMDYAEPELAFSVKRGTADALKAGTLALDADKPGALTVSSNYYWRLTQVDVDEEGWLEIKCPAFYYPTRTEDCVCGYACEGEKKLTLGVAAPPEPGRTHTATLRFEIFRGQRVVKTVTVTVTVAK